MPSIPSYPTPTLTREQVLDYVAPLLQLGWEVFAGQQENQFIVRIEDNLKLFIEQDQGRWRVSTGLAPNLSIAIWAYPESIDELQAAVNRAVPIVTEGRVPSFDLGRQPAQVRLRTAEPASNLSRLAAIVNRHVVEAVFDAYLDNKGLDSLLNMASLGVTLSPSLRIITSSSMPFPHGGTPRLTKTYASGWQSQLALGSLEIRHRPYGGHQRRFFLLSHGKSLILGPSLNNLDVNEAAHIAESSEDLSFFESEWAVATVF